MKYIDADRLIAEIERLRKEHTTREYRDEAALVLEDLEDYIESLQQEQPEVDLEQEVISYFQGMWPGIDANTTMSFTPPAIMRLVKHFYELGKAAKPKVMQEVSDNVDKLRAISTPAEEDWFKVAEEWEEEGKQSVTDCDELEDAANNYISPIENDNIRCESNKAYCQGYGDAFVDLLPFLDTLEEPVSDNLEAAAIDIADALLAKPKDYALSAKADYWNGAYDGIIAGAEWMAEQLKK